MLRSLLLLALLVPSALLAGHDLSVGTATQLQPAVAGDGRDFLAAWTERTTTAGVPSGAVYAGRFTRNGVPLDGSGIRLAGTSATGVAVAYGGGRYLVVWRDSGVRGAFVDSAGVVTGPFTIAGDAWFGKPSVVWNGSEFFVVWAGPLPVSAGDFTSRIFGAKVSPSGTVSAARQVSPEQTIAELPEEVLVYTNPEVAWNGHQYLVAWLAQPRMTNCAGICLPIPPSIASTARLDADGSPLEVKPLNVVPYRNDQAVYGIGVASNGSDFLVVLDLDGIDTVVIADGAAPVRRTLVQWFSLAWRIDRRVAVTFDGVSYDVAWQFGDGERSWLGTTKVNSDGSAVSRPRVTEVVSRVDADSGPPAVAANGTGDTAMVTAEGPPRHVRAYFAAELQEAPEPPQAPREVTATLKGPDIQLRWSGGEGATGFLVNESGPKTLIRDVRSEATVRGYRFAFPVYVFAYNSGGLSAPSDGVVPILPHRRPVRH